MKWKECVRLNEAYDIRSRFEWPVGDGMSGFDCNVETTINDAWGALSWLWTWPGDYLLNLPVVRSFFELGPDTIIASWWSVALPWIVMIGFINLIPDA